MSEFHTADRLGRAYDCLKAARNALSDLGLPTEVELRRKVHALLAEAAVMLEAAGRVEAGHFPQ
jgi:hypothetical protein